MTQVQLPEGFGQTSYTSERSFKFFKLEEGQNVYRVLPPMKSMRNNKRGWGIYFSLVYGWNGVNKQDPTKVRFRPFLCLEEREARTGMVLKECPAAKLRAEKLEQWEKLKERCERERTPESERKMLLAPLADWLKTHTVDRGWRLLVMNRKNEFGILRISHKAKKSLDAAAQKLSQQGYDPFGQKGVWLEFNRSGMGFETVVDVQPLRTVEMVNGRRVEVVAESELTYDLAAQALDVCPDLNELMESYRLSEEQVRTIVEGSGDPEEVDAVWGWSQKSAEAPSAPVARQEAPAPVQPKPAPVQAPAPAPVPVKAAPVVAPPAVEEPDEEALLLQKLQEARAKKLAAAAKPAAPVVAEASQLDLPDDDFESLFKRRG
jgi:hypothetical protein